MPTLCRDCLTLTGEAGASAAPPVKRCPHCGSSRLVRHTELDRLSIAHMDCDAFFAAVEKRDRPELKDKPVIVGGGKRGVVATCCYVARLSGVRSAMPMFKALERCPDAVVIKPDLQKYAAVGHAIREMMRSLTPSVEPLSIDEAFMDLTGTERLHGRSPAESLAWLALEIERQHRVTVSIGLSHNKFLAKMASELDKPRGFAVIGEGETLGFLEGKPVNAIWGVGEQTASRLKQRGFHSIGDLRKADRMELVRDFGRIGQRLHDLSWGRDARDVKPERETKSVSAETTFNEDISNPAALAGMLWPLCEKVARRLREKELEGRTVVLKLKTGDFRLRTRSTTLPAPIRTAESLYQAAHPMLFKEADGTAFRLIGVGLDIGEGTGQAAADAPQQSLFETAAALPVDDGKEQNRRKLEDMMAAIRERHGASALQKGRSLSDKDKRQR